MSEDTRNTAARQSRTDPPALLPPTGPLVLEPEEVRQLWSFVHGDIMEPGLRSILRASLGLCPRHTWGYAVVEIELWQTGAGARAGHQPFDVTILYEDLLEHVAAGLDRPAGLLHRHPERILVPTAPCRICTEMAGPEHTGLRMGYAGSDTAALTDEANTLEHTRAWCRQTAPVWRGRVCPACDPDPDPDPDRGQQDPVRRCRAHLAALGPLEETVRGAVAARLRAIRSRMLRLTESMTERGAPAGPEEDASWIEALGFFAGWGPPLALSQ
ncbi:hypothetical protein [Sinomonas sp.]|jgi:hypothetical protein|uniref:hypothetical protein n=1 Tax=Sinomonas sp. TaxID=1914986 RepID=UPI002FE04C3B